MRPRPSLKPLLPLVVLLVLRALAGGLPTIVPLPVKATAATYVYEKDQTSIPSPVLAALNRLNREQKITATTFDADTVDGTGDVPSQYKVALTAAKTAGLPSLVVTAGDTVLRVVKAPTTEQQVLEAVP